ncbi:DUF3499 domain-containing protein [Corynebacterium sp. HMSC28B08]|uniref:DUF3499 domain-containing protein n=1 Tax=Corynebacterium sp. HMSC28B08 TaxID=1581066 RepID=UPI0008A206B8|nr:DUF3499 domain-containing protein [Corynebacterium sp. HMSC28B08]OFT89975.1 hypothetical protein HMPREF3098_03845 [Corynebacterium sp. HMSC28B08]
MTFIRQCSRPGCSKPAVATLEFNYSEQRAIVGPLKAGDNPHQWNLCDSHAKRTTVPQGWTLEFNDDPIELNDEADEEELLALARAVQQAHDSQADGAEGSAGQDTPRITRREDLPQPTGHHPAKRNLPTGAPRRHLRTVSPKR